MTVKKFKVLDTFEDIRTDRGKTKRVKVYLLDNGEKFRITYENSNGSPLGFNSKMCISQYSQKDAQWHNLEDISILQMSMSIPSYFSKDAVTHMNEFFSKMEERMIKIYS